MMRIMTAFLTYALVASLLMPASALQNATGAAPSAARPRPTSTSPPDGGWPRAYSSGSGARIVLYEPQVASWLNQRHIVMYSAVQYTAPGASMPVLGTIRIEAVTKIAVDERLVNFSDLSITGSNFPSLSREQLSAVVSDLSSAIPRDDRVIGLDRVMAAVDASQIKPHNVAGVKADPPFIFTSPQPAVLVNIDGEPIWSPIKDNDLRFAVNTNWDLFEHGPTKAFYLRIDTHWMKASNIGGPWLVAKELPPSFAKLPDDENWKDVKAALHPTPVGVAVPSVFVSKAPAELLLFNGVPTYTPVPGTRLLWVNNTDSDVFRATETGPVYYLVSGRWFSAPTFNGPWTFATPTLPEDFKRIPLDHPRSRVLASVPGTTQALEAVLLAQVPQTARVNRKDTKAPDVVFRGEPQFEPIERTKVSRAVNVDKDILKVGDLYYMCFDAVWFVSKNPDGPWTVADSVAKEIYEIPISSPAYNVTYVTVESSDDEWVDYEAAAAYSGMMVAWGCAMWGTGWYYPPYYWGGGYYPVYYPHYPTYGYGARYNPWTGAYTRAGAVYGPYGGAGYAARYNPRTGTYARGAAAWGPGGARGAAAAWNPRTGTIAQTRQGANAFGSWGSTAVQRGDQWARTSRVTNRATGTTTRATQGSGGGAALSRNTADGGSIIGKTGAGNVYAGHDGNVYRNQGGSWQKYESGGWNNVQRPNGATGTTGTSGFDARQRAEQGGLNPSTRDQLDHDRAARSDGAQRTRDLGNVRSSGGSRAGSYRPSGGGFGGGGGMRMGGGGFRGGGGRRR
jgi:hypothetical protein